MSPLTKTFVILLVVLSMLNAAAEVVFVSKVQPLTPRLEASAAALASAQAQAAADRLAAQRAEDQYSQEVKEHAADHKADMAAVTTLQGQLNELNVQIAQLQADKTSRDATINQLNSNLTLVTSTATQNAKDLAQLRILNDGLVKRTEEDSRQLSDLSSTKEMLQSALNNSLEKNQALLDRLNRALAVAPPGFKPDDAAIAPPISSVAITGTVVEKQVIAGNTYLRINVGKDDGVNKGTTFNVLDGPNFLGILTIDEMDSHGASGKLVGEPMKIGQVRQGDVVKTQLRGS